MSEQREPVDRPATTSAGPAGPLRLVIAAIAAGAGSRREVARHTGLSSTTVDAAVDLLVNTGRLTATALGGSCASGGCGSCPSGRADGDPGCGVASAHEGRGPVVLILAHRPRG